MNDPIHLENRDIKGARLFSPTAGRNSGPISDYLQEILPKNASVLEIAAGTGEHAVANCQKRPDIDWQPSDPDHRSRLSQNAWRHECPGQIHPSLPLSMTDVEWWGGLEPVDAFYCANMIHIAPWSAALGLAEGAGQLIRNKGIMILYGPFLEGTATAPSNLKFDRSLKSRNPEWGVRSLESVKHIFADVGFNLRARVEMPAENRILVFSRQ